MWYQTVQQAWSVNTGFWGTLCSTSNIFPALYSGAMMRSMSLFSPRNEGRGTLISSPASIRFNLSLDRRQGGMLESAQQQNLRIQLLFLNVSFYVHITPWGVVISYRKISIQFAHKQQAAYEASSHFVCLFFCLHICKIFDSDSWIIHQLLMVCACCFLCAGSM